MHICGGSFQSTCMAEDFILEYDGRSDGFEPPRAVLKDEFSALGLVSTERPALEPKDAFKRASMPQKNTFRLNIVAAVRDVASPVPPRPQPGD